MKPRVHIVLVHWNSWPETSACLTSLHELDYENYRVIVVDNGSSDDSVSRIRQTFSWPELILAGENRGFSAGCNIGISRALLDGSDYVWLLNTDTRVAPDALRAMVEKAESEPKVGAVGSVIYSMERPTELQAWGGGHVNFWIGRARHFLKPVPDDAIHYLTGASLLVPRQVLETVGLLDESIFLYWEDTEYSYRLRRAGWRLVVAPHSQIWHKGMTGVGPKNPKLDMLYNTSAVRFFQKHSPTPLLSLWVGVFLRIGKRLLAGDWGRARATWGAAWQAVNAKT